MTWAKGKGTRTAKSNFWLDCFKKLDHLTAYLFDVLYRDREEWKTEENEQGGIETERGRDALFAINFHRKLSLYRSLSFRPTSTMNHLPFSHPAITDKILQRIFCKVVLRFDSSIFRTLQATKLSAIRLTQTGKLGRDTFNMARLDLLEAFQTLEDHYKVSYTAK